MKDNAAKGIALAVLAAALSLAILKERPAPTYFAALLLMAAGAWLASGDKPLFKKKS